MPGAKAGRSSGEGPQEPRFVEGPEITHYWLKVKNPAYERKEPVEFRTTAKKCQELSFDVGRASLRERLYGGVLQCDALEHAQTALGEVAVSMLGDGAIRAREQKTRNCSKQGRKGRVSAFRVGL